MTLTRRQFLSTSALAAGAIAITPFGRALAAPLAVPAGVIASSVTVSGAQGQLDAVLNGLGSYTPGNIRKVVVKPGTYKWTKSIVVPSGVSLDATGSTFILNAKGVNTALLQIVGVSDVTIVGGIWDGNKKLETRKTEHRHAIRVHGSTAITLQSLRARNAKGDGIYIGTDSAPCSNVIVKSVKCYSNARCGLAITACNGFTCTSSSFYNNKGEAPQAGVVIEPHPLPGQPASIIDNIVFSGCDFYSNASRGFLAVMQQTSSLTPETGISLVNCKFRNNGRSSKDQSAGGVSLLRPRLVSITGGTSSGNQTGVYLLGTRSEAQDKGAGVHGSVVLDRFTVTANLKDGVTVQNAIQSLLVRNKTKIVSNSRKKKYAYDGLRIKQGKNVQVIDSAITTKHRYGVYADKGVSGVVLTRTSLSGNKKGKLYAKGAKVSVVTA